MLELTLLAALAATTPAPPPQAEDHFRHAEDVRSHFVLIVDATSGRRIRADDLVACEAERMPAGEMAWVFLALTALEEDLIGPEDRVACDSLCWAAGRHGRPAVLEALAHSCETFFRELADRVPEESVENRAALFGFEMARGRSHSPDGADADSSVSGWTVTAREWIGLWRDLQRGQRVTRGETASTLLGAAGLSVSSPRGTAHTLWDEDSRTLARAIAGESPQGAWVTGTFDADGRHRWVFALYLRGGTTTLAAERTARTLAQTLETFRMSTLERGGEPLPAIPD